MPKPTDPAVSEYMRTLQAAAVAARKRRWTPEERSQQARAGGLARARKSREAKGLP